MSNFFACQKNDQTVELMAQHSHNIYTNLINAIVYWLLSLSLCFMVFPDILAKDGALFPGNNQYACFSGVLSRAPQEHKDEVVAPMGQDMRYACVHSIHKGAGMYMSLGGMLVW